MHTNLRRISSYLRRPKIQIFPEEHALEPSKCFNQKICKKLYDQVAISSIHVYPHQTDNKSKCNQGMWERCESTRVLG